MAEGDGEGQISGARFAAPDVFLSYASQDAAVANALCGTLEQAGIPCWLVHATFGQVTFMRTL